MKQLSEAIVRSLGRSALRAPVVYEQNDCVVIEMPAPGVQCDELELRLDGGVALRVCEPLGVCRATIILPTAISLADSVIYCVGGVLSMTFVKADSAEACGVVDVEFDRAELMSMAS